MEKFVITYDDENDIVRVRILEAIGGEDIEALSMQFQNAVKGKSRRYVLIDLSASEGFTTQVMTKELRDTYKKIASLMESDRSAIFGASPSVRMIAKIALTVTGKSKTTRFFITMEEALDWLKKES